MSKISIFTTITNPEKNQYAYLEAIKCYCEFADEVIIVDGCSTDGSIEKIQALNNDKIRIVNLLWPEKWQWAELPKHLNAGLNTCTGDWCIKMDIDYIIHEKDFKHLHNKLDEYFSINIPLAYFVKYTVLNKDKAYQKSTLPLAINKNFKDKIMYGKTEERSDWCYPMTIKGIDKELSIPIGNKETRMFPLSCDLFNYDYTFRTKEVAKREFWRFSQAYATAFNWDWGKTEEDSFKVFLGQMKGRLGFHILKDIESHPKFIQERINNLTKEEFGFNNWNNFKGL